MSVSIRSCPGCDSLILADTFQCPDCGHVFDEEKAGKLAGDTALASAEMEEPCPDCGHSVRAGLVRCPDCGRFMREDIAKKFEDLQSTPQKVIYSDDPNREDYLPPRADNDQSGPLIMDAEDDGFELGDGAAQVASGGGADASDDGFELGMGTNSAPAAPQPTTPEPAAAEDSATEAAPTTDAPKEATDGEKPEDTTDASGEKAADADKSDSSEAAEKKDSGAAPAKVDADADSLLDIARQDEKESTRRRKQRRRQDKANRVLIPCGCGAWMRVRKHQMGKTVRCRKCGMMLPVPQLLRKKSDGEEKKEVIKLATMQDVDFVPVDPGNLRLKAGSVAGAAAPVDIILSEDGIAICSLTEKAKGGLFSKGKDSPADEKRNEIETYTQAGHSISGVPAAKTVFIPADKISELLIVQPVKQAHESMFAGVPVFGEGKIAIRVPASGSGSEQQFLSMGLTDFRFFGAQMKRLFDVVDFGKEQGVPLEDKKTASKCHYSGMILNALAETEYHEADPHMDLTVLGRKCGACGIAVSEESRKKQKIGGASGRGLSRAKCPKCNGKFGNNSLFAFELKSTAPKFDVEEPEEDDDDSVTSAAVAVTSEEPSGDDSTES
ncbi:MAG: hypothetical protein AB8G99_17160 [Planctomycetaceae bacterium]